MPATRTDIHRPAVLSTDDYDFIAVWDKVSPQPPINGSAASFASFASAMAARRATWATITAAGRFDDLYGERGTDQCHHCGARLRYSAAMLHRPTGRVIFVGETCLDNRFSRSTAEFQAARRAAELDREAMRIRKAVAEFVAANPDLAFMADADAAIANSFIADVARKLRAYGELSERQVDAVRQAIVREAERAARLAAEANEPREVCPDGRITITGEVVSVKWVDGYYGSTLKMTVRDDRGFKVFGTIPAALDGVERGDRVTFTAMVEAGDRDEYFGFYKRPTKAAAA